ncbi:molecular chaperone TorD [Shewanella sp.]|nr:molecular chaperone TorD [Shewanella sp.]
MNTTANATAVNQVRSRLYQLLSSLFAKEINHETLQELTSNQAQIFWAQLARDPEFEPYVNTLQTELSKLNDDSALLELAADYCGLFLVANQHSASPYASFYLSQQSVATAEKNTDETLVFGPLHQQMTQFLKQSQLQVQSAFPEPADHFAVILAYVSHMSICSSNQEQQHFIRQHLLREFRRFTDKVAQVCPSPFYTTLAQLTLAWIQSDLQWLENES